MKRRRLALGSLALLMPCTVVVVASCSSSSNPPPLGTTPGFDASFFDAVNPPPSAEAAAEASPDVGVDAPGDAPVNVHPDAAPIRCGDGGAPPCADGDACGIGSDCVSGVCSGGLCQAPSCSDKVQNGQETDVDCGGPTCGACADGRHCLISRDCVDKICLVATEGGLAIDDGGAQGGCAIHSCSDGVKNGKETDVDCGGGDCAPCVVGEACAQGSDCITQSCPAGVCKCPLGMVEVPQGQGKPDYCIDAIETTKSAYYLFWNDPVKPAEPAACAWNTDFSPNTEWPPRNNDPGYTGGDPVRGVDWCDAWSYCAKYGKHLCGRIGADAANDPAAYADFTKSEWYNACSNGGRQTYPYGNTYSPSLVPSDGGAPNWVCDDDTIPSPPGDPARTDPYVFAQTVTNGTINVNLLFKCAGGAAGLYDMSGDVAEWENSCSTDSSDAGAVDGGPGDTCLVRGGSYLANQNPALLRCDTLQSAPRNTQDSAIGFRCCL